VLHELPAARADIGYRPRGRAGRQQSQKEQSWGDAGIGAAGAIGLSMLTLGLALVVSQRRTRPAKQPTATTTDR